jgi:hypothetical protein
LTDARRNGGKLSQEKRVPVKNQIKANQYISRNIDHQAVTQAST